MHDRAVRALKALTEQRIRDAETHVAALPDGPSLDGAWKLFLQARILIGQGELSTAEERLLQAVGSLAIAGLDGMSIAWEAQVNLETSGGRTAPRWEPSASRLCAAVLELLGWVHRRLDHPESAYGVHVIAYRLRRVCGSLLELWETATSLGLDADVARRFEPAGAWHRKAIDLAAGLPPGNADKVAIAWQNLSATLSHSGDHESSVTAARQSRDHWCRHDSGGLEAARADLRLGQALLDWATALMRQDSPQAVRCLDEAIQWLELSHQSLSAFGQPLAAETRVGLEQKDFAERLRASLDG